MKGDFSRDTFKPDKHYQQVLMQQGRVQLDADWNEQAAIGARRDATLAADLVGGCGGPAERAGFGIITSAEILAELPADPAAPIRQFALSAGRYYVDGIQCEANAPFLFSWQPDHRQSTELASGAYLIYLDVWQRHLTVHEEEDIRESALGGPDTGTRVKTVWQVRAAKIDAEFDLENPPPDPCNQLASEFEERQREALPRLAAKTTESTPDTNPCTVPASAGYRGLENQLYRVEIHEPGNLNAATYKWSRENGAVVTRITNNVVVPINGMSINRLTVASTGLDDNLGFKHGDIVEIIHDFEELEGIPGALALVDMVENGSGTITLAKFGSNPMPLTIDLALNPRLRRWEGFGLVSVNLAENNGFLTLENSVEVRFDQPAGADFRNGDYWQIPARTASPDAQSGKIEWPVNKALGGKDSEFLPPKGILHRYCRLGVIAIGANNTVTDVNDCRCLWPTLTGVPRLFYVSGDGQEVMPDLNAPGDTRFPLPRPLIVGVANAHCRQGVQVVRFEVVNSEQNPGSGQVVVAGGVPTQNLADVPLDNEGLASCDFYLDGKHYGQQVEARLLDQSAQPVSVPIRFNATLSRATEVSYDPGECGGLAGQVTVQSAIDRLAKQVSLYKVGGDAQEGAVGQPLPKLIEVQVANRCGPIEGVKVEFIVRAGGGSVSLAQPVITDGKGQAACEWRLGDSTATQELEAVIVGSAPPIAAPGSVRFTAKVPVAKELEAGLHIKDVLLGGRNPSPLQLGMIVRLGDFGSELLIVCDREVDPRTVNDFGTLNRQRVRRGEPACFVKVELPIPLTTDDNRFWGDEGLVGYAPIVLAADVKGEGNVIIWKLSTPALNGLNRVFARMKEVQGQLGDRLLARLTLKGNFIWALGEDGDTNQFYLDGESFRLPPGTTAHDLQLPSGDKRRGGDFEMWFWIQQD